MCQFGAARMYLDDRGSVRRERLRDAKARGWCRGVALLVGPVVGGIVAYRHEARRVLLLESVVIGGVVGREGGGEIGLKWVRPDLGYGRIGLVRMAELLLL